MELTSTSGHIFTLESIENHLVRSEAIFPSEIRALVAKIRELDAKLAASEIAFDLDPHPETPQYQLEIMDGMADWIAGRLPSKEHVALGPDAERMRKVYVTSINEPTNWEAGNSTEHFYVVPAEEGLEPFTVEVEFKAVE
jgi:hypothetical protein